MKILHDELTVYEIAKLHLKIVKELTKAKNSFTLNFENVEKIDLSTLQLLLSLKKECESKNIQLKLTHLEARQIKQMIKMFNLKEQLGLCYD